MRIGVFVHHPTLDGLIDGVRDAAAAGFPSVWTPQIFGFDAMTALAVAAREVPDVALGTAVVPVYPRHPTAMAAQALTVQEASGGRFTLGIGLSHQIVIEGMFGMSFAKPATYMADYLSILMPLLDGATVAHDGEMLTMRGQVDVPGAPSAPEVLVAALGARMLGLAGAVAHGTVTWMTGPQTVASHIVPTINAAAAEAGRPTPKVVVALPTAVTDDPDGARAKAAEVFATYGFLPSYRKMLDLEGVAGPADVAVVGTADEVRAQVEKIVADGATEFVAVPYDEPQRTLEALVPLLG